MKISNDLINKYFLTLVSIVAFIFLSSCGQQGSSEESDTKK